MNDKRFIVDLETVTPSEARFGTDDHQHSWMRGNNILSGPFAECLCGATAELKEVADE